MRAPSASVCAVPLVARAAGVCRGPARGWQRSWLSLLVLSHASSRELLSMACPTIAQFVFHFLSGLSLPLGLPLQLSPLLRFHRQDVGVPPATTLLSLPLGCPPSGPLPPA